MLNESEQPPRPRISIGLAVYNGERFLEPAILSILQQTYTNIELVICDNASDDRTQQICQEAAARDDRVRYYRNPENVGGVRNENRTFFLSRGEFFKLAAHDDLIAPTFLDRCIEVLDSRPDVDVCFTGVTVIDENDVVEMVRHPPAGTEPRPHQRVRSIGSRFYYCEATYGLMRVSALREVRPQANHVHSDRVVLSELAVRRPFFLIAEPLFFKRSHPGNVYKDWRGRMAWYQPDLKRSGRIRLPHWLQLLDYLTMLGRVPVDNKDRLLCAWAIARWAFDFRGSLGMDIFDGTRMLLSSKRDRQRRYQEEERWR